jgi:flagellar secretion chaperone FliS
MKKSQTELSYLRAAAQSATSVGLVIILYDLLLHDLELAIAALADRDIERRTAEIKHSFLVLQQLEGSLDQQNSAEGAKHLAAFYRALRCKILEAHIKASPEILRQQIALVLDVRLAWQQVDKPNLEPIHESAEGVASGHTAEHSIAATARGEEFISKSWTA